MLHVQMLPLLLVQMLRKSSEVARVSKAVDAPHRFSRDTAPLGGRPIVEERGVRRGVVALLLGQAWGDAWAFGLLLVALILAWGADERGYRQGWQRAGPARASGEHRESA